jgi:hypothetical protein
MTLSTVKEGERLMTTHSPPATVTLQVIPEDHGLLIHLSNSRVEISSEIDAHWPRIHSNCYAPAALTGVHLLDGGGSGTAVFEGRHPVTGDIVMKHGGPKDLQEVFSLSLISQQLQERRVDAEAVERMRKRIPEFVMIYFSPFSLRDRERERWSHTMRPQHNPVQKNEDDSTDDESDSDDTNDSSEYPIKRHIPRRIRLVEGTDEVALDICFNFVSFEIPASTLQCRTVESGHAFLAELLEELIPVQQEQKWKFTVAQKKIGGSTAQNGAAVLTSGKLNGELLGRLIKDFIGVVRDLRQVTLPSETMGVEAVRNELRDLRLSKDVTSISKTADEFVGSAIKKNFAPGGRFQLLRDMGKQFRSKNLVLTEGEQIPAHFLGLLLKPKVQLGSIFFNSPAPKSALDDYWLDLLEHASSFEHPPATDRIWSCGLTDAGLHNLFLCRHRGVELFDLGEPQLSPQPAFLTKFFMSFFHAFGMEENEEGTSWVRRFRVVHRNKLDLTLETQNMMSYCYDAFTFAMDELVEELFEGDESVRELLIKYVVLQLLSDAAFCLARWEEKGGGKKRFGARATEGLEKWLWRSLWDVYIACDVHQKLLIDGSDSLMQNVTQSFTLR